MRGAVYLSATGNQAQDTWSLLRQTCDLVDRCVARRCQIVGLRVPAYELLSTLRDAPKPITAYRLAQVLGREHHSVVELVNRLKAKGWITRATIEGKPSLEVTPEGAALLEEVESSRAVESVFEAVGAAEVKRLTQALEALRDVGVKRLGLVDMGELRLNRQG